VWRVVEEEKIKALRASERGAGPHGAPTLFAPPLPPSKSPHRLVQVLERRHLLAVRDDVGDERGLLLLGERVVVAAVAGALLFSRGERGRERGG
jgi:hypothetical protein